MNVTIPLSPDLIHRLDAEAARRGLTSERLVSETLDRILPTTDRVTEDFPPANIPDEMLRREHLYEDRDAG